jgi:membrane-associated PAP2 superfamily phosphatase
MLDRTIDGFLIIIAVAVVVAVVGAALGNRPMVRAGTRVAAILGVLMVIGVLVIFLLSLLFAWSCRNGCEF